MKIFKDRNSLQREILGDKNISFVPTMGGLHSGHVYLIKRAKKGKGKVLVSIYVNPKQFNNKKDFLTYPRNKIKDLKILEKLKIDYLYLPNYTDIFTHKSKNRIYLDRFSSKLCGRTRKNHFKGVVTVVNQFLDIIKPKLIYLGNKDFQQLYLIKKHIIKRKINTRVVACKTIREKNGIACSSRNKNLNSKELFVASKVFHYLKRQKINMKKNGFSEINNAISNLFELGINKLDYLELVNLKTLRKPSNSKKKFNIFIAYYLKNTRLIDNF
jgi:pantoate--beta-alanine ligase